MTMTGNGHLRGGGIPHPVGTAPTPGPSLPPSLSLFASPGRRAAACLPPPPPAPRSLARSLARSPALVCPATLQRSPAQPSAAQRSPAASRHLSRRRPPPPRGLPALWHRDPLPTATHPHVPRAAPSSLQAQTLHLPPTPWTPHPRPTLKAGSPGLPQAPQAHAQRVPSPTSQLARPHRCTGAGEAPGRVPCRTRAPADTLPQWPAPLSASARRRHTSRALTPRTHPVLLLPLPGSVRSWPSPLSGTLCACALTPVGGDARGRTPSSRAIPHRRGLPAPPPPPIQPEGEARALRELPVLTGSTRRPTGAPLHRRPTVAQSSQRAAEGSRRARAGLCASDGDRRSLDTQQSLGGPACKRWQEGGRALRFTCRSSGARRPAPGRRQGCRLSCLGGR